MYSDNGVDYDTIWSCWCCPFAKICYSRVQRKTPAELWLIYVLESKGKCPECSRWVKQILMLDEDQPLEYVISLSQLNDFLTQR